MSVITVGNGKQYSSLYAAAPHVKKGDVIELYPGTYSGALFYNSNITIRGVGPGVVITGGLTLGKGLLVLAGNNVTVENITFKGAQSSDGNGSGIRFEGTNLTVLNSTFLNNQDGILTTPNKNSTITVKGCTFDGNGSNAGGVKGSAHAIYVGIAALLDVQDSTFTNTQQGHSIKSRARNTVVKNNTITDGATGTSSYLIDIPNGGAATITGNYLEKGPNSSNFSYAISIGAEGATNPAGPVLIAYNTYVNNGKPGIFAQNQTGSADFTVSNNAISGLKTTLLNGKGTVIDSTIPAPDHSSRPAPAPRSTPLAAKPLSPDFNADGSADILLQNKDGQVIVWTMNGTSGLGSAALRNPGSNWKVIAAADFNGDGRTDVALQLNYGQVQIWTLNGTTLMGSGTVSTNPGSTWHAVTAGDFNGDGKADLVFQNDDHRIMVWQMNGAVKLAGAGLGNPGKAWDVAGAADFNGDGKSDILMQSTSGAVQIWTTDGTRLLSASTIGTNPGAAWKVVGTGDFNGDRRSDILFQNANGQVMVWQMNGSAMLKSGVVGNPGSSWKAVGAGDYNGDGKDDILFQNANGQVMAWTMNGLTMLAQGTIGNPGSAWHAVVGG